MPARIPVSTRQISPPKVVPLRHEILWPSIPVSQQAMDYDTLPTTRHLGAFLTFPVPDDLEVDPIYLPGPSSKASESIGNGHSSRHPVQPQKPIGILTLTSEQYPSSAALPPSVREVLDAHSGDSINHVQLHKFAILTSLQGKGIGKTMWNAALDLLQVDVNALGGITLLHLDARRAQREVYEKMGAIVLDDNVRIKRGPGDAGPPTEYIRMGTVVDPSVDGKSSTS